MHSSFIRRGRAVLAVLAALALPARLTIAGALPDFDAADGARPSSVAAARARSAAASPALQARALVASTDERFGVPSFVWAVRAATPAAGAARARAAREPAAAAREHLTALAPLWRLQRADLEGATLRAVHDTGEGAVIASFTQVIDDVPVFRDELKVCMTRDLELVSVSGYLPARAAAPSAADAFQLPSSRAVGLALRDFGGLAAEPAGLLARGTGADGYESFATPAALRARTDGLAVERDPRARRVWFHLGDALEPAIYVEVMGETAAYATVWSARDGRLLFRRSLMQDVAFAYRLWAHSTGDLIPMDGPQGDGASPHPTGTPNFLQPALVAPSLVSLQNGPLSTNDPWLSPLATQTTGNNVDAYADLASPDGFSAGDVRATTTSANTFDRTYDVNLNANANTTQRMASVTSLFYLNNYLHDMFYDAGFDEAAGNAQTDNYGRGGLGADPLLAEGQDYGGTNNANMSTPADGSSPRMQMYVFNVGGAVLTVNSPGGIAGNYLAGTAAFGPQNFTLTGQLVAGNDAVAPVEDGCSAITSAVAGKIALIDRGTCSFVLKAQNAQAAGAIGVIIANNVAGSTPPGMSGTGSITIPVLSVTQADGALLRASLGATVNVTLNRPVQVQRDGTIDNFIVSHEWGHYISNRLIGNAAGLSNQMGNGMGEGWADFHSLLMTVRPGDDLSGCFAVGGYALSGSVVANNSYYFGVRRYPYSTDMSKNPLTFKHVQNGTALPAGPPLSGDPTGANNAEVHNTGEVWCAMLWECYAALLGDSGRLTFAQAHERMKRYVVAGYKLTPNAPTLTEARDAILAAAAANDPADFALFAAAFARRGAGTGAVSPPRESTTNVGVTESFVVGGDLRIASVTLVDDLHSCDDDSYLDGGERGTLAVTLVNTGATSLTGTNVSISSWNGTVTFPGGTSFPAPASTPFGPSVVHVPVQLENPIPAELLHFDVSADDPGLLVPGPRTATLDDWGHVDETPAGFDDAEAHHSTWTADAAVGSAGTPWGRVDLGLGEHSYHVDDAGAVADLRWVSPPLNVATGVPLVFTFTHRWSFEFDASSNYDGGVLELSNNGGGTWTDIGGSASPGYTGAIVNGTGNPLAGRLAWVGQSGAYPGNTFTTVNLGTAYQGQTVRIRFRHAADAGTSGPGWWVDNINVSGIIGQPFTALTGELDACEALAVDDPAPRHPALALAGGNPSHGTARLRFALPGAARVQLTVHDLAGRLVATLADGEYGAGWHDAAFARSAAGGAPGAGVYFARLRVNGTQFTQRLVIVR